MAKKKIPEPGGAAAVKLRRMRERGIERLRLPADALPGSLAQSKRRCGKRTCHCADGEGHPVWSLTFMAKGKKRVEHIPADWVDEVGPRVVVGHDFKVAVAELFVTNAELLVLARKQRGRPDRTRSRKQGPGKK